MWTEFSAPMQPALTLLVYPHFGLAFEVVVVFNGALSLARWQKMQHLSWEVTLPVLTVSPQQLSSLAPRWELRETPAGKDSLGEDHQGCLKVFLSSGLGGHPITTCRFSLTFSPFSSQRNGNPPGDPDVPSETKRTELAPSERRCPL